MIMSTATHIQKMGKCPALLAMAQDISVSKWDGAIISILILLFDIMVKFGNINLGEYI